MRKTAKWQQRVDERILEHLRESGVSSPSLMASRPELHASRRRIRERCLVLAHARMIAPLVDLGSYSVDTDHFVLTRLGVEYLDGELDARYHRPPPKVRRDRGGGTPAMPRISNV
jgi:hypothetical protein